MRREDFCGFEYFFFHLPFTQIELEKLVMEFHSMTTHLEKQHSSRMPKLQYIHFVTFSISGKLIIVIFFQNLQEFL